MEQRSATAIVIGGSIAGLLAARVLSDHFTQVVVLERDALPETVAHRKGTPQSHHAHALLGQGQRIMEAFFPGLTDTLVQQGAPLGYGRFFFGGGYFARHAQTLPTLYVSRPCLEAEVRRRVRALSCVRVVDRCDALGLVAGEGNRRITGVRILRRQDGAAAEILPAALVVDASGRGSRTPAWLEELGYAAPAVDLVEVGMGYASRLYARKLGDLDGDLLINVAPTPQNRRASAALAQEGDRWIVTLAGYFGDHPPTDEAGFRDFARKLPTPDIYELIASAAPLSDPVPFKFPANQRRRYERLAEFPAGLLVLGDAICSFTPIYGQGMSTATMQAPALQACLAQGPVDLERRFSRQAAAAIDNPWNLTVGNDQRLSGAALPAPKRLLNWYMARLQLVARRDPEVALAFLKVGSLFAAPPSLLHPRIALRVLKGSRLAGSTSAQGVAPFVQKSSS
ncbi:MAG: FAD-binding monooxygenase [Anaerolineales bacterium]|nr:FAD-binding monooxygenase [Anaerolineales bacterium]